jgi:hypothetical protein
MEKSIFQSSLSPYQKITLTTNPNTLTNYEIHCKTRKDNKDKKDKRDKKDKNQKHKKNEPIAIVKNHQKTLDLLMELQNFDETNGTLLFQNISTNKLQHFLNGNIDIICSNLLFSLPNQNV